MLSSPANTQALRIPPKISFFSRGQLLLFWWGTRRICASVPEPFSDARLAIILVVPEGCLLCYRTLKPFGVHDRLDLGPVLGTGRESNTVWVR